MLLVCTIFYTRSNEMHPENYFISSSLCKFPQWPSPLTEAPLSQMVATNYILSNDFSSCKISPNKPFCFLELNLETDQAFISTYLGWKQLFIELIPNAILQKAARQYGAQSNVKVRDKSLWSNRQAPTDQPGQTWNVTSKLLNAAIRLDGNLLHCRAAVSAQFHFVCRST